MTYQLIMRCGMLLAVVLCAGLGSAAEVPVVVVEGQPLAANVLRVMDALNYLGSPLSEQTARQIAEAAKARDAKALQRILDEHVPLVVSINPESRVKVERGLAKASLQQA